MNLFSFTANLGSEDDCRNHFKAQRDKIGVVCKCGHTEHFWIKSIWTYECKKCRSRTSHYNINEISVHEDLDKDKYDIWFKNDSLPKEEALKFLQDTLFSKLNIKKRESTKKIIAKELMIENKKLLEKSIDKETRITGIQGKKTMYSRVTLKDLADELNKILPYYFVFLSKDKEVYNFFINDNSYEKTIEEIKKYGITVRNKELEIRLFEFYHKN